MIVDAHVHQFPERLFKAVRGALHDAFDWQFQHGTDPAEADRFLASKGVARYFLLNYAHKPGVARSLNEWNAAFARTYPAAIPFGTVHPEDEDVTAIMRDAVERLGLVGFKLHLDVIGMPADDPRLRPVYAFAAESGKPVVLHAGAGGSIRVPAGELTAGRLARVLDAFPSLRVCVPHLGAPDTASFFSLARSHPNLWFDTAVALSPKGICYSNVDREQLVGLSHRIMFGSDFPDFGHTWQEELDSVLELGLPAADLDRILYRNALKFAGIGQPHEVK